MAAKQNKVNGFKLESKPLSEILPAPYNPRLISEEQQRALADSLNKFGLVQPLVWNKRTGYVVGGNQRLEVLKQSGATHAEVIVVDLDDAKERTLNIALNRLGGEFVWKQVAVVLQSIIAVEPKLSELTGFKETEVRMITHSVFPEAPKPAEPEEYNCPHCGNTWTE